MSKKQRRTYGTGRVFKPKRKRKSGKVWVSPRYYIRYYQQGELVTEPTEHTKKKDAEAVLRDRLKELDDLPSAVVDPKACTFEDLEKLILEEYELKRQDPRRLKTSLNQLRQFFRGKRAREITSADWRAYLARRQRQGAATSTILNEKSALHFMLTLAAERGYVSAVPPLRAMKANNTVDWLITEREMEAILAEIAKEEDTLDIQHALLFLSWTGWRPNEVYKLTWDRVDLKAGKIEWERGTTKTKVLRVLWFNGFDALRELIHARRASADRLLREESIFTPWVFHQANGNRTLLKRVNKAWHRAVERIRVNDDGVVVWPNLMPQLVGDPPKEKEPYPYLLKGTARTRLERLGVPLKLMMEILGHTTYQSSLRYSRPKEREYEAVWARLNAEVQFKVKK